ncbi:hypothetical protein PYCCODRAFT_1232035 [Trametes coccinea BRFM310]|uniref:Uncharacterized protein n=1 Tax=Trametes coccinea (strain BRFM310) TaxID=1353009 RepID=A0A1Y2IW88_TRAC3|nr:hypothetical protein PYCCODRAFT_1232035 [Trametes coccinea BRFM310]
MHDGPQALGTMSNATAATSIPHESLRGMPCNPHEGHCRRKINQLRRPMVKGTLTIGKTARDRTSRLSPTYTLTRGEQVPRRHAVPAYSLDNTHTTACSDTWGAHMCSVPRVCTSTRRALCSHVSGTSPTADSASWKRSYRYMKHWPVCQCHGRQFSMRVSWCHEKRRRA